MLRPSPTQSGPGTLTRVSEEMKEEEIYVQKICNQVDCVHSDEVVPNSTAICNLSGLTMYATEERD